MRATFSDGRTIERKTAKPYTHAYRWNGKNSDGYTIATAGFASSRDRAERAMRSDMSRMVRPGSTVNFQEIVEVSEASRQGPDDA